MLKGKLSTYKQYAWTAFANYIKARDRYKCITCGIVAKGWDMNAGHWLPGRWNSILFEESCVHAQCVACNNSLGGNHPAYGRFMLGKYGQKEMDRLEKLWRKTVVYTKQDYKNIQLKYEEKLYETKRPVNIKKRPKARCSVVRITLVIRRT